MSLTKGHIVHSIRNHLGLPKRKSANLVDSMLETIKKTLESGEGVLISGFGKFREIMTTKEMAKYLKLHEITCSFTTRKNQ